MGRELTRRYSTFFEQKGKNPLSLVYDIYKYGKLPELVSFIVWELLHRLKLFPKEKYLRFASGDALTLSDQELHGSHFGEELVNFFRTRELTVVRARHDWKVLFICKDGTLLGSLHSDDKALYKSRNDNESTDLVGRFDDPIKSIFVSSQNTAFVCTKGRMYRGRGTSFERSLDLSTAESFFRHNNAMTETRHGTLLVGEYGNVWDDRGWRKLAYLYSSTDDGKTWERSDFLLKAGTNKHVHLVRYSKLLDRILVADGDNKKKLWLSGPSSSFDVRHPQLYPVNRFHIQMGGYTSMAESDQKILLGTDYQGGTNFIVETRDCENFVKRIVPDPYRRSPIDNIVQRKAKEGNEIWANLPYSTSGTKCLLMYTANDGERWNKVIQYRRASHKVWLVSSSSDIAETLYFSIEDSRTNERAVYKIRD